MTDFHQIDGYVADTLYPSNFHQEIQPFWLDAVLALRGIVPPRSNGEQFTYVDLGCGDGLGLILTAALHPQGHFIGVDIMPDHVARGQAMIDQIGLTNISLRCSSFSEQMAMADGRADYVVAHGVLTWVSPENQTALMDLTAKWLRPGGVFTLSYNALPGWAERTPFQALVRSVAKNLPGTSTERFNAAYAHLRPLGLIDPSVWQDLDARQKNASENYFAHEYLHDHWSPLWSGDVITDMATRDLAYIGHACTERLRDDLCLTQGWRAILAQCVSVPEREIAADILTHCWFRRDIYVKAPFAIFDGDEAADFQMQTHWAIWPGSEDQALNCETLAGQMSFDNDAAGVILDALKSGPKRLSNIAEASAIEIADLLNTIDALWIAERVIPAPAEVPWPMIEKLSLAMKVSDISIKGAEMVIGAPNVGAQV
jgi:SAM-dependent methyltransferase